VGRALATNRFGSATLDDARVPGALVPAGPTGSTAAQRLQQVAGAEQAETVARGELRRALEGAGDNSRGIAAVTDRFAETLRSYPSLARDVTAAQEAAAFAERFARSPLARAGASDPVATVGQIMRQQDGGRELRRLVGQVSNSAPAAAGLRRAMAGYVENASAAGFDANGAPMVRNAELQKAVSNVLDRTRDTGILSREQRNVLLNVRLEAKRQQFAATANRTPGSDTARNAETWGRFVNVVLQGAGGAKVSAAKTLLDAAISVVGRADAVRQLTVEAMLDPKLAADLLRVPTPDRVRSLGERMQGYSTGAITGAAGGNEGF
jgi:hypothetical protein